MPGKTTPLHVAAADGNVAEVARLLDGGISVAALDDVSATPLHLAAREGKLDVIRLLLERGALINARDWSGWTPIFAAASRGQDEVVQYLLNRGASPEGVETDERSILHLAAWHPAVLGILLPLVPMRINHEDRTKRTPLDVAIGRRATECVRMLKECGAMSGSEMKKEAK